MSSRCQGEGHGQDIFSVLEAVTDGKVGGSQLGKCWVQVVGGKEEHTEVDSSSGWSLDWDSFLEMSQISLGETRSRLAIWGVSGVAGRHSLQGRGEENTA